METVEAFERARAAAVGVTVSISDAQLQLPTPCSEWNVRDAMNHVHLGDILAVAWIRGDAVPADRNVDFLGADPRGAVEAGLARTSAELAVPGVLDRVVATAMGQITVATLIERRTADLFVHTWDLAVATGQSTDLDPELADSVLDHYRGRFDGMPREGMPIEEVQPVADGASAADRLAAYLGRTASRDGVTSSANSDVAGN
jgi:uncharacterized protein (TIGR03086 family)